MWDEAYSRLIQAAQNDIGWNNMGSAMKATKLASALDRLILAQAP
jgi:hypothetical protein